MCMRVLLLQRKIVAVLKKCGKNVVRAFRKYGKEVLIRSGQNTSSKGRNLVRRSFEHCGTALHVLQSYLFFYYYCVFKVVYACSEALMKTQETNV